MIKDIDFSPSILSYDRKCDHRGCVNTPEHIQFYHTEWELMTGANIRGGLMYCEECILKHENNIKTV